MLLLFLPFAVGCGGDGDGDGSPLEPEGLLDCRGPVTVNVSAGKQPTFSWTPECALFSLNVEPANAGNDLWGIISPGQNVIGPPVRYGIVPDGATQTADFVPLANGVAYKVVVAVFTGPGDEDGQTLGTRTFIP